MANTKAKCKQCSGFFFQSDMIKVPAGRFCTDGCMFTWLREKQQKAHAVKLRKASTAVRNEKKTHRAAKKKFNDSDRPHQLKLTQSAFNKMRVQEELLWFEERGLVPVCISCGKPIGGDIWCCGHFRTRGASSSLRFDRRNTFLQHNYSCNMKLSGDISGTSKTPGYKVGLINRFGLEAGQAIIDYCESQNKPHTFDCANLIEMRKDFSLKFRELQIARRGI